MGHVINPHLFRLNYTVFWNISLLSKKKFSIFIDLKSLIIYNFFNNYFCNYDKIRQIKLRILKIKISFYCNSAKIFFFFVKHKNLNRNFKKMFNKVESKKYYITKLVEDDYLNGSFLLNYNEYLYKTRNKFVKNILQKKFMLKTKNNKLKTKNNKLKNKNFNFFTMFNKNKNYFLFLRKNNFLFTKNYKSLLFRTQFTKRPFYFKFFSKLKTKFNLEKLFNSLNVFKKTTNKISKAARFFDYNFSIRSIYKYRRPFTVYNYSVFKEFRQRRMSVHYDYRLFFKRKINYFRKKNKLKRFNKKLLNKEEALNLLNQRFIRDILVHSININKIDKPWYLKLRKKSYKKSFFFLNIKKKYAKNKNFFTNKYFKYFKNFIKKKKKNNYKNRFIRKKIRKQNSNRNKINKKKIVLNSVGLNRLKIKLDYFYRQQKEGLGYSVLKLKAKKKIKKLKMFYKKKKIFVRRKEILIEREKKITAFEKFLRKSNPINWVSLKLKTNLKVVREKFLLFNFVKIFLKLKKNMYNIFNRVYSNSVSLVLTICLKKKSRWKLTSDYLNDLIIVRLKQKHRIKSILKFVIKYLNKMLARRKMLGYAILLKGRFSRKDRAVYQLQRFGKSSRANKTSILDFSNKSVNLTYSKAAISVWITRHM